MDVERESLPIINFSKPTTSQEAIFSNLPLERESENSVNSSQAHFSSSLDATPSEDTEPTRIVMVSLHGSSGSVNEHTVGEDAVLQNPSDCCSEGMAIATTREGSYKTAKVRISEAGLNDEPEAKRVRVEPQEEFEGETIPLGETEVVAIEEDKDIQIVDVVSDNVDSYGEQLDAFCVAEGQLAVTDEDVTVGGLVKDCAGKVDASNGYHELRKKCERVDIQITRHNKSSKTIRLKHNVGEKCSEVKLKSDASGSEKADVIMKDAEIPKDMHIDECVRSNGKRIKEIEEFRYMGDDNTRRERRAGGPAGVWGRRRQLPPSFKSKEKEVVGNSEKKRGFFDLMNELKSVFGDKEDECEEVDILETAKQCGWTFPRVRWWPLDGEDWNYGLP